MPKIQSANPNVIATVNVFACEGGHRVHIYLRVEPESYGYGAVGLALDASRSMMVPDCFDAGVPEFIRNNKVEPFVLKFAEIPRDYSADEEPFVDLIYWAVGDGGRETEPIGLLTKEKQESLKVGGPVDHAWGGGTRLAPPMRYYADKYKESKSMLVFLVIDGKIDDMEDVVNLSLKLGREQAESQRGYFKFVILGFGDADAEQMDTFNDLFDNGGINDPITGEELDPWDARMAKDLASHWDVMGDVSRFPTTMNKSTRITDDKGALLKTYNEETPLMIEFQVKPATKFVTVDVGGYAVKQPLA